MAKMAKNGVDIGFAKEFEEQILAGFRAELKRIVMQKEIERALGELAEKGNEEAGRLYVAYIRGEA